MTDAERAALGQIGQAFKQQTGTDVVVQQVPFDQLRLKFQMDGPAGLGPDLITGQQDWVGVLATAHLIDAVPEAIDRTAFNPTAISGVTFNDQIYGCPYTMETIALIYNTKLMPEPAKTLQELFRQSQAMTHGEQHGVLFALDEPYFVWPIFSGYGARLFKPDGDPPQCDLDSPAAVKAATLLQDIRRKYKLMFPGVNERFSLQLFLQGKAAAMIDGPWVITDMKDAHMSYRIVPIPPLEDGGTPRPFVNVSAFMMNRNTLHREQTLQFLKFVTSRDMVLKMAQASGRIPTRKDSLEAEKGDADVQAFAAQAAQGEGMPNTPAVNPLWDPFNDALKLIVAGADPQQTLHDAVDRINEDIRVMME